MLNFFKKIKSTANEIKEAFSVPTIDIEEIIKTRLGENSFEVKYLKEFFKTEEEMNRQEKEGNFYSTATILSTRNHMNLIKVFEKSINIDFDYVSYDRIRNNRDDLGKILFESDEEVQNCIKQLYPSRVEYFVYFRAMIREQNIVYYEIAIYSDYNLYSLNCYLSERYRLKYTKKEYRQEGMHFAHEGDPCTLIEMGKGSLLVHCNNFAGPIGEIGVHDSKNILPYFLYKERYIITCEVVRKISGGGEYGAIVQVDIYDNPLYLLNNKQD